MKKFFVAVCAAICVMLVCVSVLYMKNYDTAPAENKTRPEYIVKEYSGKIAVFVPEEEEPLAVYEIYVHLLPENDIEMLRRGISVKDDYELQKTLEDFGL